MTKKNQKRFLWSCITAGCSLLISGLLVLGIIPLRWIANAFLAGMGLIFLAAAFSIYSERWNIISGRFAVAFIFLWVAETGTLIYPKLQLSWGSLEIEYLLQNYGKRPYKDWTYWNLGGPLGYKLEPLLKVGSKKVVNKKLIYNVEYSLDKYGYRKTRGGDKGGCSFVFYSDSFTFGDGLNDKDALPEQFSKNLNYLYQVANLGVSGYGPHQMLRSLELDLPSSVVERPISTVFYIWIPQHAYRAMGATSWNRFGPKYILNSKNQPALSGDLNDISGSSHNGWSLKQDLVNMLRLSKLFTIIYRFPETMDPDFQARSIKLLTAIVAKSRSIVNRKYGAKFVVITWGDDSTLSKNTINSLKRAKIPVVNNREIFTNWSDDFLIKGDGHPSALANHYMGKQLADRFGKCRR